MSSHGHSCSHASHGSDGHICGALPGSGVTQTMDEMKFQRGVWGAVMDGALGKLRNELQKRKHEVHEVDPSGYTPLHYAARAGNSSIVLELLQAGALPDAATKGQQSAPIHRAAYMGHTQVIKSLLEWKASINIQDSDGCTALHKASSQGHLDAVKLLLSMQADHSLLDVKGRTAKQVAKTPEIESLIP